MTRIQKDLYASLQLLKKKQDKTRLLSETNDILNYFHNINYRYNLRIINWMLWIGVFLPLALAIFSYILKTKNIIYTSYPGMLFFCGSAATLIYLLVGIYIISEKKKIGRMDDIVISSCKHSPSWSLPALKSASIMILSLHSIYEKRLSTFKLICTAFPVILALVINIFSGSFIDIYTLVSKDTILSFFALFIICAITLLLVTSYIELIVLVFYINHCSSMKASIDFLISISENNSFE